MGHDHVLSVPVSIGPLVLRIAVLILVLSVAGFALMWPVASARTPRTAVLVARMAAAGVAVELILAGGFDLPAQFGVLVLAVAMAPLLRHRRLSRAAPWVLTAAGGLAVAEFGRGWLGTWSAGSQAVVLHTGAVFALAGLAWLTVCQPRSRLVTVAVAVESAALAVALVAAIGHTSVLRPLSPTAAGFGPRGTTAMSTLRLDPRGGDVPHPAANAPAIAPDDPLCPSHAPGQSR
jgi:hypothetical protein